MSEVLACIATVCADVLVPDFIEVIQELGATIFWGAVNSQINPQINSDGFELYYLHLCHYKFPVKISR